MSEDKRIIVPPLPEDIHEAIDAERQHAGPPEEVLERVRSRLHLTLGLPGPGGTGGVAGDRGGTGGVAGDRGGTQPKGGPAEPVGAAPPSVSALASLLKPVMVLLCSIGIVGGVAIYALMQRPSPTPMTTDPQAARDDRTRSAMEGIREHGDVAPTRSRHAAAATSTLKEEQKILDRARVALLRKTFPQARRALDEHRRRFPSGHLAEERDALSIIALARLGQLEQARAQARRFQVKYPRSLLQPAINAVIGMEP